jgi:hypothetical protein
LVEAKSSGQLVLERAQFSGPLRGQGQETVELNLGVVLLFLYPGLSGAAARRWFNEAMS